MVHESAVVVFDDERAVENAGVMLPMALAGRLGIEALVDQTVDLGDRPGTHLFRCQRKTCIVRKHRCQEDGGAPTWTMKPRDSAASEND